MAIEDRRLNRRAEHANPMSSDHNSLIWDKLSDVASPFFR
jgi:hypothetical protein